MATTLAASSAASTTGTKTNKRRARERFPTRALFSQTSGNTNIVLPKTFLRLLINNKKARL